MARDHGEGDEPEAGYRVRTWPPTAETGNGSQDLNVSAPYRLVRERAQRCAETACDWADTSPGATRAVGNLSTGPERFPRFLKGTPTLRLETVGYEFAEGPVNPHLVPPAAFDPHGYDKAASNAAILNCAT